MFLLTILRTWAPFKAAYDQASAVYVDDQAMQKEINAAYQQLYDAAKKLERTSASTDTDDGATKVPDSADTAGPQKVQIPESEMRARFRLRS